MQAIRSHLLVLTALLTLALAVSAPSAALAAASGGTAAPAGGSTGGSVTGQNGQLSKLTGGATPEEQEEELAEKNAASVKSTESKPVSTGLIVLIGTVAAVLLGGIAFLIVRDARSVAPATGLVGSARDQATRQRKRKAKAKAARQARKRNR